MRKPAALTVAALLGLTCLSGQTAFADEGPTADPDAAASTEPAAEQTATPEAPAGSTAAEPAEEAPVPEAPVAEEPAADEPAADEPAADEPAPAADEPAADEPAADEPAADEPAADEPAADEPAADEPAGDEPAVEDEATVASEIVGVTRDRCVLTISIKLGDDGTTSVELWDDGTEIGQYPVSGTSGQTVSVTHRITASFLQEAAGIGIFGYSAEGVETAQLDPYDFEGSEDIGIACAASGGEDDGTTPTPPPPPPTGPSSILQDEITRDVCEVTIWVEHGDGQQKSIEIWDDGELVTTVPVLGSGDSKSFALWTITKSFQPLAPGVALILTGEDGERLDDIETWDFPGSGDIGVACAASAGKSDKLTPEKAEKPAKPEKTKSGKKATGLPSTGN